MPTKAGRVFPETPRDQRRQDIASLPVAFRFLAWWWDLPPGVHALLHRRLHPRRRPEVTP